MSESALVAYREAREHQLSRNDARRIRTRVTEARNKAMDAGGRWPFELLQNAHDAGPRPGRAGIRIRLATTEDGFLFEHDGAVFQPQDLAALLSGGSSKDFEGEDTTGRFGTGFLVTHVLSEQTEVSGILATKTGSEWFSVSLDRGGNEEQILANIDAAKAAILSAQPLNEIDREPSARFVYRMEDKEQLEHGLETFRTALPYLFATCPKLDEVVLVEEETTERWLATAFRQPTLDGLAYRERSVQRESSNGTQTFVAHILSTQAQPDASAIFVSETDGQNLRLVRLPPAFPRVFRRFPIRGTTFLRTEAVLEGHFNVDQERREVLLKDQGGELVEAALDCLVLAALLAHNLHIEGAHWLARVGPVAEGALSDAERAWWAERLKAKAAEVAQMPLVKTPRGVGRAFINADGWYADFVGEPRLGRPESVDGDALWELAVRCENFYVPEKAISRDWSLIAQEWKALGVEELNIFGLADFRKFALADEPKAGEALPLEALLVTGDRLEWLARLYELADVASTAGTLRPEWLDHLLLNQHGKLVTHASLTRDLGVLDGTKLAAEKLKLDLRASLLDLEVLNVARKLRLARVEKLLGTVVTPTLTEHAALDRCLSALDQAVQPKKNPTPEYVVAAGTALLAHMWASQAMGAGDLARRVPLATTKPNEYHRWNRDNPIMAPVSTWPETARPYSIVYPSQRVMHVDYGGADGFSDALKGLQAWGIAHTDPLQEDVPSELRDRRLAALVRGPVSTTGLSVRDQACSSIALLSREVINHCTEPEHVKALLGLILTDIVVRDKQWRTFITVLARRGGQELSVELRPALWVADLLSRAWIPVTDKDGKQTRFEPSPTVLRDLIDREWLKGNPQALEFLAEVFSFDRLELRLLGYSEEESKRIRDVLAELIDRTQTDPDALERALVAAAEQRESERRVAIAKSFGLAVQEALRTALQARGFVLELVDRGFDYETRLGEKLLEDASSYLGVERLLLEVKATTSGEVRLTPTQAATASRTPDYVLCVVDLRGIAPERLASPWTPEEVAAHSRFVNTISGSVASTWALVERAQIEHVPIRNEAALRFGVAAELWQSGLTLSAWCDWAIATLRDKEVA
ncbi:sacsin N-terminal ATP-binding-like domain-containing protein [Pyxidicoccus sp. 3LG]